MEDELILCKIASSETAESAALVAEDEDDEFKSCCGEDSGDDESKDEGEDCICMDGSTVKMYFKGVSIKGFGESYSGYAGIGAITQCLGEDNDAVNCLQKRLDFYVEDLVAEYLALIDGFSEVLKRCDVRRVFGFTDNKIMYEQIMLEKSCDNLLIEALRERVLEITRNLEAFSLKLVPSIEVERPLQLAWVAMGLVSLNYKGCGSLQNCSICCDDKPASMMLTLRCSHKFCSHCLRTYAEGKVETNQVPIRCPQLKCNSVITIPECKLFLPNVSYECLVIETTKSNALTSEKIYCPYQNCSALIDPRECLSSDELSDDCVDCPVCQKSICVNCSVPWHDLLSCEEYQDVPLGERDASDLTLHRLARARRWRRCQQCRRMIEFMQGCYHMTCWCGHEFCYACGAEYRVGQQTCECAFLDDGASEELAGPATPEADRWQWNSFDTFPMILDAYSDQERSQLALIQRYLAGGFSLSDHHPCQSPPPCTDSYVDALKDIHQLPWLERFVSVISDNYYDNYFH